MHAKHAALLAATAAAAALATSAAGPGPAGAARKVDCLKTGRTLDANGQVRLFRVGTRQEHTVYACRLRDRFVIRLGDNGMGLELGPSEPVLAGRFVAGDHGVCSSTGCSSNVQVFDVDRAAYRDVTAPGGFPAYAVQVTPDGAAAWIRGAPTSSDLPPSDYRVEVLLDDGTHVLDQGPGIRPRSLARSGSRLYWMKDGRPRTATLVQARAAPLL